MGLLAVAVQAQWAGDRLTNPGQLEAPNPITCLCTGLSSALAAALTVACAYPPQQFSDTCPMDIWLPRLRSCHWQSYTLEPWSPACQSLSLRPTCSLGLLDLLPLFNICSIEVSAHPLDLVDGQRLPASCTCLRQCQHLYRCAEIGPSSIHLSRLCRFSGASINLLQCILHLSRAAGLGQLPSRLHQELQHSGSA